MPGFPEKLLVLRGAGKLLKVEIWDAEANKKCFAKLPQTRGNRSWCAYLNDVNVSKSVNHISQFFPNGEKKSLAVFLMHD